MLAVPQVLGTAAAQDAKTIVRAVIERRAARLDGVDNYTLIETLNRAETTLYFERVDGEGFPEADAVIQTGEGTRRGRMVVRGRFETPAPPVEPGLPTAAPPAIIR